MPEVSEKTKKRFGLSSLFLFKAFSYMIAVVFLGIQLFSCSSLFLFKAFLYMLEVVFLGIQLFSPVCHTCIMDKG